MATAIIKCEETNDVNNKKQLPYHVYFHKYDGDDNFQCIEEITPGIIDFDTDMRFSKLISRHGREGKRNNKNVWKSEIINSKIDRT